MDPRLEDDTVVAPNAEVPEYLPSAVLQTSTRETVHKGFLPRQSPQEDDGKSEKDDGEPYHSDVSPR